MNKSAVAPDNPYLDEVKSLICTNPRHQLEFRVQSVGGCIECMRTDPSSSLNLFGKRRELVRKYAFAIPNEQALDVLLKVGPLVELGAGTGYWAHLLRDRGADIIAIDTEPGRNSYIDHEPWTEVIQGDHTLLPQHSDRALMLCWPPMTSMATLALEHWRGKTLVYIGESDGGCTGDEAFHAALETQFVLTREVDLLQWDGIHDRMCLYLRNEAIK